MLQVTTSNYYEKRKTSISVSQQQKQLMRQCRQYIDSISHHHIGTFFTFIYQFFVNFFFYQLARRQQPLADTGFGSLSIYKMAGAFVYDFPRVKT